ncbi:hypothetical protein [Acinetobacter sp. NIPH 298]|uniref:hypothetical protein n=1 Tax=Acinetobacter sp. NIPH 298 TaxID=1217692 RepID=UPI0002CDDE45|nr:hypothetical protein [Acinetobacter sp. NIPH 298]ENW93783.1 hypothetical protein F903_03214 [Acinetobacter sp. NIPH 298]
MSEKYELRNCALNILDYLYFHELAFGLSAENTKDVIYFDLSNKIEKINLSRGYENKKADIYKHYLLCGVELFAALPTVSTPDIDFVTGNFELYEFSKDFFLDDVMSLVIKCNIKNIDKSVMHKLVGQNFYYDYDKLVTIEVLKLFLDKKFLSIKKHRERFGLIEYAKYSDFFLRVMLFIEFEIVKKQIYIRNKGDQLKDEINAIWNWDNADNFMLLLGALSKSNSLIGIDFKSIGDEFNSMGDKYNSMGEDCTGEDLKKYLIDICDRLGHVNLFFNDISKCVDTLNGFYYYYVYDRSKRDIDYDDLESIRTKEDVENEFVATTESIMGVYSISSSTKPTVISYYEQVNKHYEIARGWLDEIYGREGHFIGQDPSFYYYLSMKKLG